MLWLWGVIYALTFFSRHFLKIDMQELLSITLPVATASYIIGVRDGRNSGNADK
jgi:hypothetical protein